MIAFGPIAGAAGLPAPRLIVFAGVRSYLSAGGNDDRFSLVGRVARSECRKRRFGV